MYSVTKNEREENTYLLKEDKYWAIDRTKETIKFDVNYDVIRIRKDTIELLKEWEVKQPLLYKRFFEILPEEKFEQYQKGFIYENELNKLKTSNYYKGLTDNRSLVGTKYNHIHGLVNEAFAQIVLELEGFEVRRNGCDKDYNEKNISSEPDLVIKDKKTGEDIYIDVKCKNYHDNDFMKEIKKDNLSAEELATIYEEKQSFKIKEKQVEEYSKKNVIVFVGSVNKNSNYSYLKCNMNKFVKDGNLKKSPLRETKDAPWKKYYEIDTSNFASYLIEFKKMEKTGFCIFNNYGVYNTYTRKSETIRKNYYLESTTVKINTYDF